MIFAENNLYLQALFGKHSQNFQTSSIGKKGMQLTSFFPVLLTAALHTLCTARIPSDLALGAPKLLEIEYEHEGKKFAENKNVNLS